MDPLSQTLRSPTSAGSSSFEVSERLIKGVYRLLIVAPSNTGIEVAPLNPPPGMQLQPNANPNAEVWNSLFMIPQNGQYSFQVKLSRAIEDKPVHVQFVHLGLSTDELPPAPPPPEASTSGPKAPSSDMQDYYRRQGYLISYDGGVRYYYVAFRTHRRTGERQICLCGLFAYSNTLHDPARAMQSMSSVEDKDYVYSRMGPFATRGQAEATAIAFAKDLFHDPTRYGVIGTGGISDMPEMRQPSFR